MSKNTLVNQSGIELHTIHSRNYNRTKFVATAIEPYQADYIKKAIIPQDILEAIVKNYDNELYCHGVTPLMVGNPKDFGMEHARKIYNDLCIDGDMVWRRTGDFKDRETQKLYKSDVPRKKDDIPMWCQYDKAKVLFKEGVTDLFKNKECIVILQLNRRIKEDEVSDPSSDY